MTLRGNGDSRYHINPFFYSAIRTHTPTLSLTILPHCPHRSAATLYTIVHAPMLDAATSYLLSEVDAAATSQGKPLRTGNLKPSFSSFAKRTVPIGTARAVWV
jgi:hypothetical protein